MLFFITNNNIIIIDKSIKSKEILYYLNVSIKNEIT